MYPWIVFLFKERNWKWNW